MKHVAVLVLATSLSGCATLSQIGHPVPAADLVVAEKTLTITDLAYEGAGETILAATQSGHLHGDSAKKVHVLWDKAGAVISAAHSADAAANASGIISQVSAANDLIVQIKDLSK